MKRSGILTLLLVICVTTPMAAIAGDFDWLKELNLRAKADLFDFKATLDSRFHIGDAQVRLVLSNVDSPADSYLVLRLSELSHRPVGDVLNAYHADHGKGWGVIARRMGIKPGSQAFHALKRGHDLADDSHEHGHAHGKAGGKGNGKHKG